MVSTEFAKINDNFKLKVNDEIADITSNWFFTLTMCQEKQKMKLLWKEKEKVKKVRMIPVKTWVKLQTSKDLQ